MENQIILIDKPTGISSFGVVAKVRRHLKAKFGHKIKVGHTGTLDPFATGLLILLTGQMTKKSNDFLKLDKTYEATLRFGYTSTTGDPEGKLEKISNIVPDINQIKNTINSFLGVINQKVPTFSAVKINGQRAYKLARAGKNFETPTRKITIHNIEILNYNYPELKIRCKVSSGTYIRALAEDIGKKLETGAYLIALRRTSVGQFSIDNAKTLDDF